MRAFLSHSSAQKLAVNTIAQKIGIDKCILDNATFEAGMETLEEILNGLNNSDLFVLFLSKEALESEWVKKEILIAKELFDENKLHRIYPIIIDHNINHLDQRIPEWLKSNYNLKRILSPEKCANLIIRRLREISWSKFPSQKIKAKTFVGRNELVNLFEERLDSFEKNTPIAIIASGLPSIGRRTFLRHALEKANIITRSSYDPPVIELASNESIEDLIFKLYNLSQGEKKHFPHLIETSIDEKIKISCQILKEIQNSNEIIFIIDDGCLILPDRKITNWFEKILENSGSYLANQVTICIASRFRLMNHLYRINENIFHLAVKELDSKERRGLFKRILDYSKLNLNNHDFSYFSDLFKGFPEQIIFTGDLILEEGVGYAKRNNYLIKNFQIEKINQLIKKYDGNPHVNKLLEILTEIGFVSSDLLVKLLEPEEVNICFDILDDFVGSSICGFIGVNKEYYSLNEAVRDFLLRGKFKLRNSVRQKIQDHVKDYEILEDDLGGDLSDFLYSVKTSLKMGIDVDSKYLIPSIYVKTIEEQYNIDKNYENVIELADVIFEKQLYFEFKLKKQIKNYLCLSLARLGSDRCLEEIQFFKKNKLLADYHFLFGFYYRMIGKPRFAIDAYLNALSENPYFNRAKRELIIVYLSIEEYDLAYKLAKENYQNEPSNPYHIQAYFSALMKSIFSKDKSVGPQLKELVNDLKRIQTPIAEEMALLAEAEYLSIVIGDYEGSAEKIYHCFADFDHGPYSLKALFDLNERHGKIQEMKEAINLNENFLKNPNPATLNNIKIMKAKMYAHEGNIENAKSLIDQLKFFPDNAKENLKRKLIQIGNFK